MQTSVVEISAGNRVDEVACVKVYSFQIDFNNVEGNYVSVYFYADNKFVNVLPCRVRLTSIQVMWKDNCVFIEHGHGVKNSFL